MIPVERLLFDIDLKLNIGSSLQNQAIPLENKIIALNNAQIHLINSKVNPNNPLLQGFEASKKRYEDLQVLVEPSHEHKLDIKESDKELNKWSADLSILIPQYMFFVDGYAIADKDGCLDRIIYINNDLRKHGDVSTLLRNSNYIPSFEYQETFNTLTNNKVDIYTDGTFTYQSVYISYIRYPKYIDYPGYIGFDDKESVKQDCELASYLKDELINFTIEELAMSTENIPAVQFIEKRLEKQE